MPKRRTIIYGGSFDPVHNAHIDIVRQLCGRFDRVIVMPCKISPFKDRTPAPAADRLHMLRLALAGTKAEISTFELEQKSPSYSYLTAEHFAGEGKLYWAIGSEMLPGLKDWNNFERIAKLVTFYVIPRPGYTADIEKPDDADIEFADFTGQDGSSSEVKVSLIMGQPEMFLPGCVADYIKKHDLYNDYAFAPKLLNKYGLSTKRISHSYSTALTGIKLAKRAGIDVNKTTTALLLHDIGKSTTLSGAIKMGLQLPEEVHTMPESIRHAVIGEAILSQREGITDAGILDAVRWHTTGRAGMSMLEIVVFLADYIEPLRDFEGVSEVRAAAESDIMEGLKQALTRTVKYFDKGGLYHSTKEAYEYYTGVK